MKESVQCLLRTSLSLMRPAFIGANQGPKGNSGLFISMLAPLGKEKR